MILNQSRNRCDYRDLFHDQRLFKGFQATITGILASGTTRVRQIARASPKGGSGLKVELSSDDRNLPRNP